MIDIVFLGKHDVGETVYEWLCDQENTNVLSMLTRKEQLDVVRDLNPDLMISGGFEYIVPKSVLDIPNRGVINMHGSYLPYNRGANTNVWPIIEDTPAGVSLHYMTPELDAGPVIDRRKVEMRPDDTARLLLSRIEKAAITQFKEMWPRIRDKTIDPVSQESDSGTYHSQSDFVELWEIDLDEESTYRQVIDHLRATTHPPFKNAFFEEDGQKYFLDISITPAEKFNKNAGEYIKRSERS